MAFECADQVTSGGKLVRSHRTLLIVDGEKFKKGGDYAERVRRLEQSLNGANIKVDLATAFGDNLVAGITSTGTCGEDSSADELIDEGHNLGYTQVLISA